VNNVFDLFSGAPIQAAEDDEAVQAFIDREFSHLGYLIQEMTDATTPEQFNHWKQRIKEAVAEW
jgi:hypothetical protein